MTKMTERLQRLRKAGFESWDDAVHSTTNLTPAAAAELLGVTLSPFGQREPPWA